MGSLVLLPAVPSTHPSTHPFLKTLLSTLRPLLLVLGGDNRYGVGQIYFRQEKYDMALVHFKSAALINPLSSVLHCYLAMTLHRQGFLDRALAKVQVSGIGEEGGRFRGQEGSRTGEEGACRACGCAPPKPPTPSTQLKPPNLQESIELDPKNPLARFEKANVLTSMEQYPRALEELHALSQLSPGEPSVYFQMGKLYKKVGGKGCV